MQSILIAGCGYIGARAAKLFEDRGARVFAMTRSATRANEFATRGWTPILADVTDRNSLAALPNVDVVINAIGYDRTAGPDKRQVYVAGLQNLLDAMQGKCGRVVTVSSTSVYGHSNGEIVDESSITEPTTDGGQICLDAEQTLWRWQADHPNLTACVLRFAGLYGPGRMLARAESLRAGDPLSGRGDAWLNLIHGDDAAAMLVRAAETGRSGSTYLGVDQEPVKRGDFYSHLAALLNAPEPRFSGASEPGSRGSEAGLNKRCVNPLTRRELAVSLAFPTYREGLAGSITTGTA